MERVYASLERWEKVGPHPPILREENRRCDWTKSDPSEAHDTNSLTNCALARNDYLRAPKSTPATTKIAASDETTESRKNSSTTKNTTRTRGRFFVVVFIARYH